MANTTRLYWASADGKTAVKEIIERRKNFYNFLHSAGRLGLMYRCYAYYNSAVMRGSTVFRSGEQNEYFVIYVNHFRNILKNIASITCNQRPTWQPRAINTDTKTIAQQTLATGLLDYYMRQKKLEQVLEGAVETCILHGEAFIEMTWNATTGKTYMVDPTSGEEIREGDVDYRFYEPVDVIRDPTLENPAQADWYCVRSFHNKWKLAAKYPEHYDSIVGRNLEYNRTEHYRNFIKTQFDKDQVTLYKFYHKKTEALPDGREIIFLDEDCILEDKPLAYDVLPVHRISAGAIAGLPGGYSVSFDLLSLQEQLNALYSAIVTVMNTYSVPNILVPRGSNMTYSQFAGEMNIMLYDPQGGGKPEAISFAALPPTFFETLQHFEQLITLISGINDVLRGTPPPNVESGSYAALLQSLAVQFNSDLQRNYVVLLEEIGTSLISILQQYAVVPRIVEIVGQNNKSLLKEFVGKDVETISRVVCDIGNPLTQTLAGKVQMGQMLIQSGTIREPEQLLEVLKTGNLEVLTDYNEKQLRRINDENEKLLAGETCIVLPVDNHVLHIRENAAALFDPDALNNPQLVQSVMSHLMEHVKYTQDPTYTPLLQMLGLPSMAAPTPPPGAGGAGPTPTGPQAGSMKGVPTVPPPAQPGAAPNAPLPHPAAQPRNPATQQRGPAQGPTTPTPTGTAQ